MEGIALDFDQMTIEHLAPQNGQGSAIDDQDIASIGNLILVDPKLNNKLDNKNFSAKKKILQKSHAWVDALVRTSNSWTPAEIQQRATKLAEVAFEKVWRI